MSRSGSSDEAARPELALGLALQILDEAADGVLVTDQSRPDNPIIYANAAFIRMTGYPLAETLGRNCRFLQGTDRQQPAVAAMREAIAAARPVAVTLRNYRRDGSMFWNEVRLAPLHAGAGPGSRPACYVGFQRDVTARVTGEAELHQALRQAEEANAAKLHFLLAMGHEFRTPIGLIVGFADLLISAAERGVPEARQLQHLGDIRGAAYHLLMLVEDARRYLQVTTSADLKRETVPLSRLMGNAVRRVEPMLHDLGARLHVPGPSEERVDADAAMLEQALGNLIAELARRAPRGADIGVELRTAEGRIVVDIRCGTLILPEVTIAELRRPFGEGTSIYNRGLVGVGVSIVVAEKIIHLHGGELGIRSRDGFGTVISVSLPRSGASGPVSA